MPDGSNALKTPPAGDAQDTPPATIVPAENPDHFQVLGMTISVTSPSAASETLHRWTNDKRGRVVIVRDIAGLAQAMDDQDLLALQEQADMVTPGGAMLAWLGRRAGKSVRRTSGLDLMARVFRESERSGLRHYFYGADMGVARRFRDHAWSRFHRLRIAGFDCPPRMPMTRADLESAAAAMNASDADIIWIGLPTPQQETLMRDLKPLVRAPLIGVGAAFNTFAGADPAPPLWARENGVGGLWRFAMERRRAWRVSPRFAFRLLQTAAGVKG